MKRQLSTKQIGIVFQMMADSRVPRSANGYIIDIQSPAATTDILRDRFDQLAKYVPELVDQFREEEIILLAGKLEKKESKLNSCYGNNKAGVYRRVAEARLMPLKREI